ncbi:MAG: anti-sigma factor [Thermoflexales bacterium]|nr:anti-sigma factor [Thermoflexales bacterium]
MKCCSVVVLVSVLAASCAPLSGGLTPAPTAVVPTAATEALGTAGFRDNLTRGDRFVLEMRGVPALPKDQAYQGWLIGDDGETAMSVGLIEPDAAGHVTLEWNSPSGENLIGRYSGFLLTREPAAGSVQPGDLRVSTGKLDSSALARARQLFVRNPAQATPPAASSEHDPYSHGLAEPATPLNTAFVIGLVEQSNVAVQHVQNAVNAAAIGSLPEMRVHLEHVINILEGAGGSRFGDHDGNGQAQNPGDGFGVRTYAAQIASLYPDDPPMGAAAQAVQAQIEAVEDQCLDILKDTPDAATVTARLDELKVLANRLQVEAITGLYQAAQAAVNFQVTPTDK